jgi:hypothetical protein
MDIPIDLTTLLECESNNTFTIVRLSSQLIRTVIYYILRIIFKYINEPTKISLFFFSK